LDHPGFAAFALAAPIAAGLARLGYVTPTPIQRIAIAPQIAGRDLLASACTGSGKTLAYGLPLLDALLREERLLSPRSCRALVLAPTRELAGQIRDSLRRLFRDRSLTILIVIGGASRRTQIDALANGADIVVATPGRLIDLLDARAVSLGQTRRFVIDEADRMLDLGFLEPVRRIAAALPEQRQTVMFSATLPKTVIALASRVMRDPVRVAATPLPESKPRIAARAEIVAPHLKPRRLVEILQGPDVKRAIVFCRTRRGAELLGASLAAAGVAVGVMHGERSHGERGRTLDLFRSGRLPVLVATDLVARGIDVAGVTHVVNYDLPDEVDTYVHRIGRTGRAGAEGVAITLVAPSELGRLRGIERAMRQPLLPRTGLDDALAARRPPRVSPKPGCPSGD
jgi:ATP-dependent RNA helicase RhlE